MRIFNLELMKKRWLVWAAALLIVLLAAYLRLANRELTPGWYSDEGTHVLIAQQLKEGRVQYMAIGQSWLLFARLPLFEWLLSGLLLIWDDGMLALRTLSGSLGTLSVWLLYVVVRRLWGQPVLALLAALMLAIYPQAVLYSRFGFSYNLLVPLVLLAYGGLGEYLRVADEPHSRRRWLLLSALAIGLGLLADVWMAALLLPWLVVVAVCRWRDLLWALPLLGTPLTLYAIVMWLTVPQAFFFDLTYTFSRVAPASLFEQLRTLALNYAILISQDHWLALALVGFFLLRSRRLRFLSLCFCLWPILLLGRSVALYNLSAYYVIPVLPFVALGMAALVYYGFPYALQKVRDTLSALFALDSLAWVTVPATRAFLTRAGALILTSTLLLSPFLVSTLWTAKQIRDGFSTHIDAFLLSPEQARNAADFVNARVSPEDVVIASPGMAWLVAARTADFQMAAAAEGLATPHLPADIPAQRFVFDPCYSNARYVIVDNLWRTWAVANVPAVPEILKEMETAWPLLFVDGALAVYCNPHYPDCGAVESFLD